MRLSTNRSEDDFEINVISLIDVLLTLLMFFVLTTTFVQNARMKVSLPKAETAETSEMRDALEVMIDRQGRYYVGNDEVLNPGLETLKKSLLRVAGDDRSRPVMLRADAMTPHQAVITAMDALAELGFQRLSIATVQAKGSDAR